MRKKLNNVILVTNLPHITKINSDTSYTFMSLYLIQKQLVYVKTFVLWGRIVVGSMLTKDRLKVEFLIFIPTILLYFHIPVVIGSHYLKFYDTTQCQRIAKNRF